MKAGGGATGSGGTTGIGVAKRGGKVGKKIVERGNCNNASTVQRRSLQLIRQVAKQKNR